MKFNPRTCVLTTSASPHASLTSRSQPKNHPTEWLTEGGRTVGDSTAQFPAQKKLHLRAKNCTLSRADKHLFITDRARFRLTIP